MGVLVTTVLRVVLAMVLKLGIMELFQLFRKALGMAPRIHPVDRGLARHWTKQRLASVFPELRGDAQKLEAAYRALDLSPRASGTNTDEMIFEIALHRDIDP